MHHTTHANYSESFCDLHTSVAGDCTELVTKITYNIIDKDTKNASCLWSERDGPGPLEWILKISQNKIIHF